MDIHSSNGKTIAQPALCAHSAGSILPFLEGYKIQKLLMRPEGEGNFNRTKVTTKAIRNIKNLGVTMRERGRDIESRVHCCERKRVTRPCSDTKCRNHGSLSLTRNLPADLKVLGWNPFNGHCTFKGRSSHLFCEL